MKLVRDILPKAVAFLQEKQVAQPKRTAEELLAHLLLCKRLDVFMQFDTPLKEAELETYRGYLRRAAQHEPYEQITGFVSFGEARIAVTKDVLIPRPETELLLTHIKKRASAPTRILDMCTGSGCLAIALKQIYKDAQVFAVDVSKEALEVAYSNAETNDVQVHFALSDMFNDFEEEGFDIIVSNPPYIREQEYQVLQQSVKDYEPKLALVGGEDGLLFYKQLCMHQNRLSSNGLLALEIGHEQGNALLELFGKGEVEKDWAMHDRFFFLDQGTKET